MTRVYPEPVPGTDKELFPSVSYWSDEQLEDEFKYLSALYAAVCAEIGHRAETPTARDNTGSITASDAMVFEAVDTIERLIEHRVSTKIDDLVPLQPDYNGTE